MIGPEWVWLIASTVSIALWFRLSTTCKIADVRQVGNCLQIDLLWGTGQQVTYTRNYYGWWCSPGDEIVWSYLHHYLSKVEDDRPEGVDIHAWKAAIREVDRDSKTTRAWYGHTINKGVKP